jgi:hypothetical protein
VKILFERMDQPPPELSWWEVEKLLVEIVAARRQSDRSA